MPLIDRSSSSAFQKNVRTLMNDVGKSPHVQSPKQALAIAYSQKRRAAAMGKAKGGRIKPREASLGVAGTAPGDRALGVAARPLEAPQRAVGGALGPGPAQRQTARQLMHGPILSSVPGRTDAHKNFKVPSGSYVIPADIVSGRGQGNTIAGATALQQLFKMGPYGSSAGKVVGGRGAPRAGFPKLPKKYSAGGEVDPNVGVPVPVDLAGGEIVVPPEKLTEVVHPDLKLAHEIMDRWVLNERKRLRRTLAKLPGPVKT